MEKGYLMEDIFITEFFELDNGNRQIIMRSDIKLPQLFASWSNSL